VEGRPLGEIDLGGKRHGSNRDLRYDGHETEEDSVAFRKRSAQFNVESLAACSHELMGRRPWASTGSLTDLIERRERFVLSLLPELGTMGSKWGSPGDRLLYQLRTHL